MACASPAQKRTKPGAGKTEPVNTQKTSFFPPNFSLLPGPDNSHFVLRSP